MGLHSGYYYVISVSFNNLHTRKHILFHGVENEPDVQKVRMLMSGKEYSATARMRSNKYRNYPG